MHVSGKREDELPILPFAKNIKINSSLQLSSTISNKQKLQEGKKARNKESAKEREEKGRAIFEVLRQATLFIYVCCQKTRIKTFPEHP